MSAPSQNSRWTRVENLSVYEARSLRDRLSVRSSALQTYVTGHDVSAFLAREQLLDLVEEAAVHGRVRARIGEAVLRLALPRRLGQYDVMIDSRTMSLFAYTCLKGASTWVESRTRADRAAATAKEVSKEQRAARRARGKGKARAQCLTWRGESVGRPEPGEPLRRWRQLRQLDVEVMV